MTTTTEPPRGLAAILDAAERRFLAVTAGFRRKSDLRRAAEEAESKYRERLDAESLEAMVRARANLSGAEIALGADPEGIAESERIAILNTPAAFQSCAEALETKLREAERLCVARREKLADVFAEYIRRGGDPDGLHAYVNQHEPQPVWIATAALRDAEQLAHAITGGLNRVRGILAQGGRVESHLGGYDVAETINSLVALAQTEVPKI